MRDELGQDLAQRRREVIRAEGGQVREQDADRAAVRRAGTDGGRPYDRRHQAGPGSGLGDHPGAHRPCRSRMARPTSTTTPTATGHSATVSRPSRAMAADTLGHAPSRVFARAPPLIGSTRVREVIG